MTWACETPTIGRAFAGAIDAVYSGSVKECRVRMPTSLLEQVAAGRAGAVEACIERYGALVWSLARRLSNSQSDAEDAVQEIFLDVWKSSARYDPSVASEATFIAMISRRRLIDRRRRLASRPQGRELVDVGDSDSAPVSASVELSEEAAAAAQALEQLRPEQQKVLRLSIYQGLSHERIAEATGMPLGTVKTHVRRGLIKVREILTARSPDRTLEGSP